MLIPINRVIRNTFTIAYTVFNTSNGNYLEVGKELSEEMKKRAWHSILPKVDCITLTLDSPNKAMIILGKNKSEYVVSYGSRQMFSVSKKHLVGVINAKMGTDGKVRLMDGKMADLSKMFNRDTIIFKGRLDFNSSGSAGQSIKFSGIDKKTGLRGVVKFPIYKGSKDIEYECLYYDIAKILGVKCCRALMGVYAGKRCVISVYEYSELESKLMSFRQYMSCNNFTKIEQVLKRLGNSFIVDFNKLMILDYIMSQEDRHMSNLSIEDGKLYPTYDNGRCLNNSSIGHYSYGFRAYVERLADKTDISKIVSIRGIISTELVSKYGLTEEVVKLISDNVRRLIK